MNPLGLFGPGESSRAIIPATKPTMMIQRMPLIAVVPPSIKQSLEKPMRREAIAVRVPGRVQIRPDSSLSVGSRPSGVKWSITPGRYWLRPLSNSSRDIPLRDASELI